jgi:(p)ppGpp synthase/HD superfamily hydrolase
MSSPTVRAADILAELAHRGQVDKAGVDYIQHPRAVARILRNQGHPDDVVIAGLLHDVVEDTTVTLDDLREFGFPEPVVQAVDSVTRREGSAYPDGKEPYMDLIRRAATDPIGRLVKLADGLTNSDPARLALLTESEREWFTAKYARARKVLLGKEDAG